MDRGQLRYCHAKYCRAHEIGYITFVDAIDSMCGPAFEYTKEDFLNDASQEEWDEWEQKAAELELPLDYYLAEFV